MTVLCDNCGFDIDSIDCESFHANARAGTPVVKGVRPVITKISSWEVIE